MGYRRGTRKDRSRYSYPIKTRNRSPSEIHGFAIKMVPKPSKDYVDINLCDEELGQRLREAFRESSKESVAFFYVIDKGREVQYTVRIEEVLI